MTKDLTKSASWRYVGAQDWYFTFWASVACDAKEANYFRSRCTANHAINLAVNLGL